jgi:hypothetical protein
MPGKGSATTSNELSRAIRTATVDSPEADEAAKVVSSCPSTGSSAASHGISVFVFSDGVQATNWRGRCQRILPERMRETVVSQERRPSSRWGDGVGNPTCARCVGLPRRPRENTVQSFGQPSSNGIETAAQSRPMLHWNADPAPPSEGNESCMS